MIDKSRIIGNNMRISIQVTSWVNDLTKIEYYRALAGDINASWNPGGPQYALTTPIKLDKYPVLLNQTYTVMLDKDGSDGS